MAARDYDAIAQRLGNGAHHSDSSPASPPLELLDLERFVVQPRQRWLVRGVVPSDALVVVFGPPKGGKTFATTDMLMHAAHGPRLAGARCTAAAASCFPRW